MKDSSAPYVGLKQSGTLIGSVDFAPERTDKDELLLKLYEYYNRKGFQCIFFSEFFFLLTFLWIVVFVSFLIEYINIFEFQLPVVFSVPSSPLFYLFFSLSMLLWLAYLLYFLWKIRDTYRQKLFYNNLLLISDLELQTIAWPDIAERLREHLNISPLEIAQRITRVDNYIVGLINNDIIDYHLPLLRSDFFSYSFQFFLHYLIRHFIFTSDYQFQHHFSLYSDDGYRKEEMSKRLAWECRKVGLISLLISPVVFVLSFFYTVFRYGDEVRNRPKNLSLRQWSVYSQWKFRHFNELPHFLHLRMNMAYEPAKKYVEQFNSYLLPIIARFIAFIMGSVFVTIMVGSFINSSILEEELLFSQTGLWLLAVTGSVLALCSAYAPDLDRQSFTPETHFALLKQLLLSPLPSSRCRSYSMVAMFERMLEYRAVGLIKEVVGVITTPLILLFVLPKSADRIVDFICNHSVVSLNVGAICDLSDFPVSKYLNLSSTVPSADSSADSIPSFTQTYKADVQNAKLENSFISFAHTYRSPDLDRDYLDHLSLYRSHLSNLPSDADQLLDLQLSELMELNESYLLQLPRSHPPSSDPFDYRFE